jgi:hypothetical protein
MVNSAKSFRLLAWDMLSPHTDPKDFKDGYASLRGEGFIVLQQQGQHKQQRQHQYISCKGCVSC